MSDLLFDQLHRGLNRVLDLRHAQHGLLASNLANANTPGYLARSLDFTHLLESAMGVQDADGLRRTELRHFDTADRDLNVLPVEEVEVPPWAADNNSVIPEREMVRMNENQMMFEAAATSLSKRLSMLRYAGSDGRSG
jgi:flagellar basal-body rod protein FlgB